MRLESSASIAGADRRDRNTGKTIFGPGIAAVLAILVTGLVASSAPAAGPAAWDAKLAEMIPKAMQQASIPGAIVGVCKDGEAPCIKAFGVRDTVTSEPMATDLNMRIGSVTKTFVTTAILQLMDQGKISLDDPIGKYLPGVPNGETITSGNWQACAAASLIIPMLRKARCPTTRSAGTLTKTFSRSSSSIHRSFQPTQSSTTTTPTPCFSGSWSRRFPDSPWTAISTSTSFSLSLCSTPSYPADATLPSPHARGYTKMPDGKIVDGTDWNPSWGWAAGQMVSTADDLHIWARDLATGKLLTPAAQREREKFQPAPSEGDGALYGLGVEYQFGWIGHNGNITGTTTFPLRKPRWLSWSIPTPTRGPFGISSEA
jgi:D-alanyl-D-alanine carboxypeptidase